MRQAFHIFIMFHARVEKTPLVFSVITIIMLVEMLIIDVAKAILTIIICIPLATLVHEAIIVRLAVASIQS